MKTMPQREIIIEYFKKHPNRNIKHPEVVDWATAEYEKRTGKKFRDPDREIRKLSQEGQLIKISKGVYRYDPKAVKKRDLEDFTPAQKSQILKRDGYKCVICGRGSEGGVELQVDHIKPKDLGGKATIANGQTLCAMHNFRKKNYGQTETGKKMFIRLYDEAKSVGDKEVMKFCEDVLKVYERDNINGHIVWKH